MIKEKEDTINCTIHKYKIQIGGFLQLKTPKYSNSNNTDPAILLLLSFTVHDSPISEQCCRHWDTMESQVRALRIKLYFVYWNFLTTQISNTGSLKK